MLKGIISARHGDKYVILGLLYIQNKCFFKKKKAFNMLHVYFHVFGHMTKYLLRVVVNERTAFGHVTFQTCDKHFLINSF